MAGVSGGVGVRREQAATTIRPRFFSHAKIYSMLDSIPLEENSSKDLRARIEHKDSHLSALWELMILYAAKICDASTVFQKLSCGACPEAVLNTTFPQQAVLEVKCMLTEPNSSLAAGIVLRTTKKEKNAVYRSIRRASKQLNADSQGRLRLLFLCDGGHGAFRTNTTNDLFRYQNIENSIRNKQALEQWAGRKVHQSEFLSDGQSMDVAAISDYRLRKSQEIDAIVYVYQIVDNMTLRPEDGIRNGWGFGMRLADWRRFEEISPGVTRIVSAIPRAEHFHFCR